MVFKRISDIEDCLVKIQEDISKQHGSFAQIYKEVLDIKNGNRSVISECEFPKIFVHNVRADIETIHGDDRLMDFEVRYDIEYTLQTKSGNSHDSSVYLSFDKTPNAEDIELAIKEDLLSI